MATKVDHPGEPNFARQGDQSADADAGTANSSARPETAVGGQPRRSYGPDERINVRDRYDVIIRPSSPPFVTVVPAGQSVTQPSPTPSLREGSLRASSSVAGTRRHEVIARLPGTRPEQIQAPEGDRRVDRIYSAVNRRLTVEKRAPTTSDVVARAFELLPVGSDKDGPQGRASLTVKTTKQAKAHIAASVGSAFAHDDTILALTKGRLDSLWDEGRGHIPFNAFVQKLATFPGQALHWADESGNVRTLRPIVRRPFARTIKETDRGSDAAELKRGFLKLRQSERGYVKVDAATALAVSCLKKEDFHNFARIVAACPAISETLLDTKKFGHGAVFTDRSIWLLIAYSVPRIRALGGETTSFYDSLTSAFENFLTYHNPDHLQGPYVGALRWAYQGSAQHADALANSSFHFTQLVERVWHRLCPKDNPIRDLLDIAGEAIAVEVDITAITLSIVMAGVDKHLSMVMERRKAYSKAIEKLVRVGGALPFDAAKGAAAPVDAGVSAGAIETVCDMLLS